MEEREEVEKESVGRTTDWQGLGDEETADNDGLGTISLVRVRQKKRNRKDKHFFFLCCKEEMRKRLQETKRVSGCYSTTSIKSAGRHSQDTAAYGSE